MRRVNEFPDPLISGGFAPVVSLCKLDYPTVDGMRWMRATVEETGDVYAQYFLNESEGRLPAAGAYHLQALCHAEQASGRLSIYIRNSDGDYSNVTYGKISAGETKTCDLEFTIPSDSTELVISLRPSNTVGASMMVSQIQLESKATYDARGTGPTVFDGDMMPYDN